jgi:phosphopantothenoylcysteine decarboxylase/phosphopantothenate--cysteine ligase
MSNILLGVTGGIACYKAVYLLRLLKKAGHNVRVVMTKDAARFVTPLTFETLSDFPVRIESLSGSPIEHITLANWADIFLIAPATANTIAKLAHGIADNLLTATVLASKAEIMIYPAMNAAMYLNPATQANIKLLIQRGIYVALPAIGELACEESGIGRLAEPEEIALQVGLTLAVGRIEQVLAGRRVLVTAGPTVEEIDSVRSISNHSSGKMGFAIAESAQLLGCNVELVSGPVALKSSVKNIVYVKSAADMLKAVVERAAQADICIMNAAVADYTPLAPREGTSKKTDERFSIELIQTADVLKEAAKNKRKEQFFAGFAAEAGNLEENAKAKLKEKGLDLMVLNDISREDIGFNSDSNEVTLFFADGERVTLAKQPKIEIAHRLLLKIAERLKK